MKLVCPEYAKDFACIADKCTDSCCVGWEIGIDEDTLERYKKLDGALGDRLRSAIREDDDGSVIELNCDGKCPFLDCRGLCDIIKEKGDSWLSEICREHPRYYNVLHGRVEWGVGLSCEAAAELILTCSDIRREYLAECDADSESDARICDFLTSARNNVYETLYSSAYSVTERLKAILLYAEALDAALDRGEDAPPYPVMPLVSVSGSKDMSAVFDILLQMEYMDGAFYKRIEEKASKALRLAAPDNASADFITRLVAYFIHRYFISLGADSVTGVIKLAVISALAIYALVGNGAALREWVDTAKTYSKEAEYNEENRDMILDAAYTEAALSTESLISYL